MIAKNLLTSVGVFSIVYNGLTLTEYSFILGQPSFFCSFELIIIDDGSKDGSWSKICLYSDHPKIKSFRRENKGLIETLKELRLLARGKYLTILASDDKFHKNKLEVMVDLLERNEEAAICIGKTDVIDENGHFQKLVTGEYSGNGSAVSSTKCNGGITEGSCWLG